MLHSYLNTGEGDKVHMYMAIDVMLNYLHAHVVIVCCDTSISDLQSREMNSSILPEGHDETGTTCYS